VRRLRALPKPIVCAVNGVAAGAGANIALACDLVLAARSASFVQSFSKIGLVPDSAAATFLPRLGGSARAMGLALLGETLSAEDAERWGLIWKASRRALVEEATGIAQTLAAGPTKGYGLIKQAMHASAATRSTRSSTGARPAARGRVLEDYREGRRRVHAEAQAAVQGQVKEFPARADREGVRAALRRCSSSGCSGRCSTRTTNVPHYRRKFDAAGVKPGDCRSLETWRVSVHHQGRPARHLSRSACSPCRWTGRAHPRLVGHHRQADGRRLHREGHRHLGAADGALDPRRGRAPGDKVHVAYGYGLFTGGLGAHYGAERLGLARHPVSAA
jgi:enoyl-CoA hydratase/carnithine racemase